VNYIVQTSTYTTTPPYYTCISFLNYDRTDKQHEPEQSTRNQFRDNSVN